MTTPELAPATCPALVQALPPFGHLGLADAALLAVRGKWILHGPGEVLVLEGFGTDGFYVLAAGQAEVVQDGARTAVLRAGDHFGEIAQQRDVPPTATIRTITPARLFHIDSDALRTLVPPAVPHGAWRSADACHETTGAH